MIRRLTLTNFRNYRAAALATGDRPIVLVGPNGAGKTNLIEAISFLAPGRGLRRATLDEVAFPRRRRLLGGRRRSRRRARARDARHRHRARGSNRATAPSARLPHRPRAGRLGGRLRRPSARGLARRRRWIRCLPARRRSAGASSTGWRSRSMPSTQAASMRSSARCARATGCWRSRCPTRIGSTPSSTRPRSLRSRSRRCAPRRCSRLQRVLADRRGLGLSAGGDRPRRLDGEAHPGPSGGRDRGALPRRAARQPRARRRRRPHARRPASDRSRGRLRRQENCRRRRLDRRAEGAADRACARACAADCGDDGVCAGAAARRGRRASRSGATPRAP